MTKRKREVKEGEKYAVHTTKRTKWCGRNQFEKFSDELVLRTFSFLPTLDLLKTEQVCKRFRRLATDNELWREKFYNQFVLPRARRLPRSKSLATNEIADSTPYYASKSAKWLELSGRFNSKTDWKRRYKVKQNWTKGQCRAHDVPLDCPVKPRILVKLHNGVIITASEKGLRSYSQRSRPQLRTTYYWESASRPTSLAVDGEHGKTRVLVGFDDGKFEIYTMDKNNHFIMELRNTSRSSESVSNVALSWPYILTMSELQTIELYRVHERQVAKTTTCVAISLTSLQCSATLSPVSLSIRCTADELVASVAYSFSRLGAGWCLGLQEIRLNLKGDLLKSRLVSTVETPLKDFPLRNLSAQVSSRSTTTAPFPLHPQLMHPPTSLSHSGCYILAGLPDNTLMVYIVKSTKDDLEISAGRRLWGHTSAVAGTEVSNRGKALSISARGDEIRVWELEDILSSYVLKKTSTQLRPQSSTSGSVDSIETALAKRGNGLGLAIQNMKPDLVWMKHWVGFDDEQVVVLGEKDQRQILSCYDFA